VNNVNYSKGPGRGRVEPATPIRRAEHRKVTHKFTMAPSQDNLLNYNYRHEEESVTVAIFISVFEYKSDSAFKSAKTHSDMHKSCIDLRIVYGNQPNVRTLLVGNMFWLTYSLI